MSKSSRATPTPDLVRELRDDELQEVSGGYIYDSTYVVGIVAAQTKTTMACTRMANSDAC
jgi:bacteriocin-like protein